MGAISLSTIFSIIVIICACKQLKSTDDTMHIFIISMTVGDIIVSGTLTSFKK